MGQTADASASAGQDDVGNVAATVQVDEPGDGETVDQENRAVAGAEASTEAAVDSPGETAVAQTAQSDASASQTDVSNTSIVVRVGSPGNDEGFSQINVATASATATTAANQGAVATAEATQDGVSNTSVSVRVFSPGDDGPVTQLSAVSATAGASPGGSESATVRQDDVQNTTVSIRVESPGTTAPPSQQNQTTAVAVGSVAVDGDAVNTVVAVAVGGASLERPGASGLQVWVWTWVWERDEAQDLASLSGLDPDSWAWSWDDGANGGSPPPGNVTVRAAGDDDRTDAGFLEWTWDWTRAGVPGWSWDWNRRLRLSCGSCIWVWNWSWSWTGQPGADDVTTPGASVAWHAPGQLNAVTAQASAVASVSVAQAVAQSGAGDAREFAGQLVAVSQDARAVAAAQQVDVWSVLLGDATAQSNVAVSAADAAVAGTAVQAIVQALDAAGSAHGDQWGGQEVAMSQLADAASSSTQHHVRLLSGGSHVAESGATAGATASVEQQLTQGMLAGAGAFSQWAGQLALVAQAADGASSVVQTGRAASRRTGGVASAASDALNLALLSQQTEQLAWMDGGLGSQTALQRAYTGQDATASAVTVQQVGAATSAEASSDAGARTRSTVLQDARQLAAGLWAIVQDVLQEAIVVQHAVASAGSLGGVAGAATVVDCAVVQQAADQRIGVDTVSRARPDELAFCLPPAASSSSPPVVPGGPTATGGELASEAVGPAPVEGSVESAPSSVPAAADDVQPRRPALAHPAPAHPARGAGGAPATSVHAGPLPGHTQVSLPPSTQARIDTRPGSHAGAGDAGREPLLPPAGDPSNGVSALAAPASGAGASGIAAIPSAFALAAPHLLRSPLGSVVRRPTEVLARIDVPV